VRLFFLSPPGALIVPAALAPLAMLVLSSRRARRIRRAMRLPQPSRRQLVLPIAALVAAAALLGLAASQPVLERTTAQRVRSEAEAFVVVDVSRSMLARRNLASRSRLERAKAAGAELRASLPGVRVGLASLTDRVLPHLFPSADEGAFQATLARAIGIERPPPSSSFASNATSLESLGMVASQRFFSPAAKHRLLVVLTDGESLPVAAAAVGRRFRRPPGIKTVFVQVWGADERVFTRGVPEARYRADPSARSMLDALAAATGGSVFTDREIRAAVRKSRDVVGRGATVAESKQPTRLALAPYLALVTFLPLALLLWLRDR
jgi:von Willebrand factor type A domain